MISGTTVDHNGKPVAGATISVVQLIGKSDLSDKDFHKLGEEERKRKSRTIYQLSDSELSPRVVSGTDGRFTIEGLPTGSQVRLKVKHRTFVEGQTKLYSVGEKALSLELDPGWRFSLTTKDSSGNVIPNARLQVIGNFKQGISIAAIPYFKLTTDDKGQFVSPPLPNCGVTIQMEGKSSEGSNQTDWISRPKFTPPGKSDELKSVIVEIEEGKLIHGKVTALDKSNPLGKLNPKDLSISYFVIKQDKYRDREAYSANIDSKGHFVLRVPSNVEGQVAVTRVNGKFQFDLPTHFENVGYSGSIASYRKEAADYKDRGLISTANPLSNMPSRRDVGAKDSFTKDSLLMLPIARSKSVTGTVVDESGKPVAGAKLEMLNKKKTNYGRSLQVAFPDDIVTDEKGKFEITGIQERFPPVYRATHPDGEFVNDFGWPTLGKNGGKDVRLQFQHCPSVRAIVQQNGEPLPGQDVTLRVGFGSGADATYETLTTDANGTCVFENVPRRPRVWLYVKRPDKDRFDKNFSTLGDEKEFTISDMNFVSKGSGVVAGKIVDPNGQPIANARVHVAKFTGDRFSSRQHFESVRSNASGHFKATKVPPNTQLLLRITPEIPKEARYPRSPMDVSKVTKTGEENLRIIVDPRLSQELPWRTKK